MGQPAIDFDQLDGQLRSVITNREVADAVLLQAIFRLGPVREEPSFWTNIADDPIYSKDHRRRAVFALFRRHCREGQTCREVVKAIAPATWLRESSVEKIDFAFGKFPIDFEPNQSVFRISVLNGPSIYLRVEGEIDAAFVVEDPSR